jgi:polyisoprenoid-binding protein YceI
MGTVFQNQTTGTYRIDAAHSEVGFEVKHLMISTVRGRFAAVNGTIELNEAEPYRSSVDVEIDAASIDTRQEQRDSHLRSPDFFDVQVYPAITFRSTKVGSPSLGRYVVTGDLTVRDITREVVLEVRDEGRGTDPWGGERAGFSARTKIDRRDFGLTWNQALETGGVLVGNEIKIVLDVQAVRAE